MTVLLPSLFAAAALGVASDEGLSSRAAENFIQVCVDTGGERAAVTELARTRGWIPIETPPQDGVVWTDAYRTGESVVALYLTPATDASSETPSVLPRIQALARNHCLVGLRAPTVDWRQAATVLDVASQLTPFPEMLQPAEGAGQNGAVRYYSLVEQLASVTLRENRALGTLEILIVRGLPDVGE